MTTTTTTAAAEKFEAILSLERRAPRSTSAAAELRIAMSTLDATEAEALEAHRAAKVAESFARQEAILRDEIAELNELLGLTDADHSRKVTFGYIGNGKMTSNGWDLSDCLWSVYLPHPGRVGKAEDRVGEFRTGSLEGIVATRRALKAVIQGVRLARSV